MDDAHEDAALDHTEDSGVIAVVSGHADQPLCVAQSRELHRQITRGELWMVVSLVAFLSAGSGFVRWVTPLVVAEKPSRSAGCGP